MCGPVQVAAGGCPHAVLCAGNPANLEGDRKESRRIFRLDVGGPPQTARKQSPGRLQRPPQPGTARVLGAAVCGHVHDGGRDGCPPSCPPSCPAPRGRQRDSPQACRFVELAAVSGRNARGSRWSVTSPMSGAAAVEAACHAVPTPRPGPSRSCRCAGAKTRPRRQLLHSGTPAGRGTPVPTRRRGRLLGLPAPGAATCKRRASSGSSLAAASRQS